MKGVLIPKSSNIFAVAFDEEKQLCFVTFKKGDVAGDTYEYEHASRGQVTDMIFADSVGVHFSAFFKKTHTQYRKLSPEETALPAFNYLRLVVTEAA